MADEEDVSALMRGERDLYARDFRNADLTAMSLSDRDFGKCSLQKADLSRADLSRSNFNRSNLFMVRAEGAILREAVCENVIFQNCNFSRSDCSGTRFFRSHFVDARFDGAILLGADFSECVFGDGISSFDGAIIDRSTIFDRATGSRAQARQSIFAYYEFERGEFKRREDEPNTLNGVETAPVLAAVLDTRKAFIEATRVAKPAIGEIAGIGHNYPPEPLSSEETANLKSVLGEVEISLRNRDLDKSTKLSVTISEYARQIGLWAAAKAEVFVNEFAKGLGKEASTLKFWIGLWLVLSGQLTHLANLINDLFKF
ncbi:pentapeptide repeat-containing protein [Sphingomonas bacterium]|uniref:pentapeptide repeat-containing protein n=1 Tax=Sphingomonas bacterium TaxID=1895847 RepID=UPI001576A2E3|nr:pentapeptide repeat-containing protein [Sphingomonas bacterium]